MGVLQTSKIQDTDYFAHFYTMKNSGSGSQTPDTPDTPDTSCQHNYTQKVTGPTCTKEGYTTYTCTLCQDTYTSNPTAATGHNYTNGVCTKCNAKEPSGDKATIDFSDTSNRIVFNDNQQVWVLNGITVTNDKANSQNKVADFSNPIRCYAGSNVTIAYPGMTSIEIDCKGLDSKYVNGWLKVENATATLNNGIVTVVFNSPVDSFTYTALSAQSRANNITVHALVECTHTSTTIEGASDATCTTDGHTGTTRCAECNEILDEGETIPATGHKDDNNDGVCDKCSTALSENGTTNTPDDNDPDNTPDSGTTTPPTEEPATNDSKTTTIVVIVLVCGVAFIGIGIFFSKKKF